MSPCTIFFEWRYIRPKDIWYSLSHLEIDSKLCKVIDTYNLQTTTRRVFLKVCPGIPVNHQRGYNKWFAVQHISAKEFFVNIEYQNKSARGGRGNIRTKYMRMRQFRPDLYSTGRISILLKCDQGISHRYFVFNCLDKYHPDQLWFWGSTGRTYFWSGYDIIYCSEDLQGDSGLIPCACIYTRAAYPRGEVR